MLVVMKHIFKEKNEGENNWINSGFFILSKRVFDYLDDDQTIWEEGPLNKLAKNKQLEFGNMMVLVSDGFIKRQVIFREVVEE